jgi:CRISPR/Cas system CMR-associated protein Cmr5 small subunit
MSESAKSLRKYRINETGIKHTFNIFDSAASDIDEQEKRIKELEAALKAEENKASSWHRKCFEMGDWIKETEDENTLLKAKINVELGDHIVKLENGIRFLCEFIETAELVPINKDWGVPGVVRYGLELLKKPTQENNND